MQGQNADEDKFLKAEMYKLNVYGPGSFFKAHKDTPRSEDMIGSLVVIFPTIHAARVLCHDVTHAVEPVQTGYRVTLTYNLFLADRRTATGSGHGQRHVPAPEQAFERALCTLLASPTFLPAGGFLVYGLTHQYPFPAPAKGEYIDRKFTMPPSRLGSVLRFLRGSDVLYESVPSDDYDIEEVITKGNDVLADDVLGMDHVYEDGNFGLKRAIEKLGLVVQRRPERTKELQEQYTEYREHYPGYADNSESGRVKQEQGKGVPVHWVTKITDLNRVSSSYLAYGNQASIAYVYGNAALFVQVPPFGEGLRARSGED
ncbi:hypothetical protein B0H12DRAFT_1241125 [Mycena haematopus]|nr:hypothetical protein B0H12DRAFT_1241125 [Mycena haematopus]